MAAALGVEDRLTEWTVAVDKQDKIGVDGVCKELSDRGFNQQVQDGTRALFAERPDGVAGMDALGAEFDHPDVQVGLSALKQLWALAEGEGVQGPELVFAPGLARGLNHYTGAIFEVQVVDAPVGSICGGGRYDDLTGIFGMPGERGRHQFRRRPDLRRARTLRRLPQRLETDLDVLVLHMGEDSVPHILQAARECRAAGLRTELYPDSAKLKKQFKYADDRRAPMCSSWAVTKLRLDM